MKLRTLLFGLALGCGARTDLGGHVAADAGREAATAELDGVVVNQCSPNDGLAISFILSQGGFAPTCSLVSGVSVEITFWSPLPTTQGTYTIGDGSFPSGSSAVYCPQDGGGCVNATQGTLDVTDFTSTASGSFSIVLPDATTVTGSFEKAVVCNNSLICG